jgi:molybdenum cofactor cytidylyltransferase
VIVCILLAAGRSERFGGKKLLATLPNGKTVLQTTLENLCASGLSIVVVVRDDAALEQHVQRLMAIHSEVIVVKNTAADSGMASSIVCGVLAAKDATGWLIALGDMPYVRPQTYQAVAEAVTSASAIAVAATNAKGGQPVGFGRGYVDALCALKGDTGARGVITAHPQSVSLIEVGDLGIFQDIDTPEDLRA